MTTNIAILDTVAAAGADAVVSNGYLVVTGLPNNCVRLSVIPNSVKTVTYTAGTAGTWRATFPAGAAGDSVQVVLICIPSVGQPITVTVNYSVSATLTAAANGTAFGVAATAAAVAIAAAKGVAVPFTVSGTTTPILTGSSAYLQIEGYVTRQPTSTYLTTVTNALGTASRGTVADVTAQAGSGALNTDGIAFTGTTYTKWEWQYPVQSVSSASTLGVPMKNILFINTGDADAADLVTRLTGIFNAVAGTYADTIIEAIADI